MKGAGCPPLFIQSTRVPDTIAPPQTHKYKCSNNCARTLSSHEQHARIRRPNLGRDVAAQQVLGRVYVDTQCAGFLSGQKAPNASKTFLNNILVRMDLTSFFLLSQRS